VSSKAGRNASPLFFNVFVHAEPVRPSTASNAAILLCHPARPCEAGSLTPGSTVGVCGRTCMAPWRPSSVRSRSPIFRSASFVSSSATTTGSQ
jgi:hypothetical protein